MAAHSHVALENSLPQMTREQPFKPLQSLKVFLVYLWSKMVTCLVVNMTSVQLEKKLTVDSLDSVGPWRFLRKMTGNFVPFKTSHSAVVFMEENSRPKPCPQHTV